MMVCMTMIRIYVVNVSACNQKKMSNLFPLACKGHLESLKLSASLNGKGGPRGGGRGLALYSLLALADRSVPVRGEGEDSSQHPVHGTYSWIVAGPTSPSHPTTTPSPSTG